ncbi:hypothetical protein DFJ77DRAFT_458183 [Powellomyces hirtus]|nr:hypothetical protein DFJ77DRAFT_458183 [Powellomyces hirtus]
MTRVTKLARKTHEEASGFNVTPLLPTAAAAPATTMTTVGKPADGNTTKSIDAAPVTTGSKRKTTDNNSTPIESTADVATGDNVGSEPEKKKKRMRHRSKTGDADGETTGSAVAAKSETNGVEKLGRAPAGGKALTKAEKEALRRRTRRERNRERKMTCFLCRNPGHSISACPKATEQEKAAAMESPSVVGICYKCGSMEHKSSQCRKMVDPKNPYPFAHCFVCNKTGHIACACPENERGLYPNGGGCKYCGSVRHFAKDCKPALQEAGITTLGKIDLRQGGDDDDVFVALKKMDDHKEASVPAARSASSTSASQQSTTRSNKPVGKKKVVKF